MELSMHFCLSTSLTCTSYVPSTDHADELYEIAWTTCFSCANMGLALLGWWRCFANNYLHWAGVCTWVLLIAQGLIYCCNCLLYCTHYTTTTSRAPLLSPPANH
ncbi:hypothetical protein EVAR_12975_1 [Eumeta japonica]|uniref:Uncharacterized protein n=1 Tax=Eumeta variegata TaxID=151549 RepID=A0A4C1TXA1_EUMVA|nr:hypothetical protein EVAR_12975_1 [Eumeta japonica]